jgi:hypothetical protein
MKSSFRAVVLVFLALASGTAIGQVFSVDGSGNVTNGGNLTSAGSITSTSGVLATSGSAAGTLSLSVGTSPTMPPPSNTIDIFAPTSSITSYALELPTSAPGSTAVLTASGVSGSISQLSFATSLSLNTTGNAATATTCTNVASGSVGAIPYQSASGTTTFLSGNTVNQDEVLTSTGTGTLAQAPTLKYAPAISAANMPISTFPTLNQSTSGTAAGLTGTPNIAVGVVTASAIDQTSGTPSPFGGTCTMVSAATCPTTTISHSYSNPVCICSQQASSGTFYGCRCTVSSTTVYVSASASNSATFGFFVFGNPN